MNKLKYLLFLLFIPISVNASCNASSLSRYKSLASNINNYYSFNGSSFDVTFYNVSNELRIVDLSNNNSFVPLSNFGDVVINNVPIGSSVNYAVYPIDSECSLFRVYTFYIGLPHLNNYYTDPICVNNSSNLCFKWTNTSMYSYEQFIDKVKNSKVDEEEQQPVPTEEIKKYGFFDFLADYYIYILLVIIFGGITGIYFLNKKDRFDF